MAAPARVAPLITPECHLQPHLEPGIGAVEAPNPSYRKDACRWTRYGVLLGLNKWEADMCTRVVLSIIMGSIIGFERRRADRPAGIRTMAMVCLGACVFTIDSMFAFLDGTMGWDASRVSAAIPSGGLLQVPVSATPQLATTDPQRTTPASRRLSTPRRSPTPRGLGAVPRPPHRGAHFRAVLHARRSGVGFLGAASIWKGTTTKGGDLGGKSCPGPHMTATTRLQPSTPAPAGSMSPPPAGAFRARELRI